MKLIRTFQVLAAAPFVVLPENFRMFFDEALRVPREDQIFTVRQRLAETLKCFAPHDDDVAHGRLFEPFEILRQMPRDFIARADDAVQ